ncbi:Uncharacterised protein [uncultured archaeon]|nr:Uncharacterised protein [uncultured archaeon]
MRLACKIGLEIKTNIEDILSEYDQAAAAFSCELRHDSSDYDLMMVKQRYLLASAALIKNASEIFGYQDISRAASFFEAAAWAYLDESDRWAYRQRLDNRFILNEESSRFLRSRLKAGAERANKILQAYIRELQDTSSPDVSTLRFLLYLVQELPTGAWECAPCLAVCGKCGECGYGRDHGICAHPGSTYEMLVSSREAILKSIRRGLIEDCRRPGAENLKNVKTGFLDDYSESSRAQMEIDICGEHDIVEECD